MTRRSPNVPDIITPEWVAEFVAVVRYVAEDHDDEVAHAREDEMHVAVLLAIATGKCSDPAACASAALESNRIKFARWCA
jgi:hypothetical protein